MSGTYNDGPEEGVIVPITRSQEIAEDIVWAFRGAEDWALTTGELVDLTDVESSKIKRVLEHLEDRGELASKPVNSTRIWWMPDHVSSSASHHTQP